MCFAVLLLRDYSTDLFGYTYSFEETGKKPVSFVECEQARRLFCERRIGSDVRQRLIWTKGVITRETSLYERITLEDLSISIVQYVV
jgi:hypothetical protein